VAFVARVLDLVDDSGDQLKNVAWRAVRLAGEADVVVFLRYWAVTHRSPLRKKPEAH